MRQKSDSIGTLGRSPARASKQPTPPPREPSPPERGTLGRWIHGALFDNVGLKFLSIVLAVTVFLLVNTDKNHEISVRVRLSYTSLPSDKVLVSEPPDEIRVTIKGSTQRLRTFDETKLDRINLDLRNAPSGEIAITRDMIHLPAGLEITSISPRSVHVAIERRVEKLVEVNPQTSGRPQHGYVISEIKSAPATIKVRGAEAALASLSAVRTREVPVEGRAESFVAETEALAPEGVELEGSPQIVLHVTVDEELVTRTLPGLVVAVRGDNIDAAKWTVTPAQVEVTLTGTLLAVEKAKAALVPSIKLAADGKAREVDVAIEGLPPGIGVKVSPERVRVAPVK